MKFNFKIPSNWVPNIVNSANGDDPAINTSTKQDPNARSQDPKKLANYPAKVQLERTRQDVEKWREAIREAENAWYPFRVKMQALYQDTILNGHVKACMDKRKDLTILKEFCFRNGDKINEDLTKQFQSKWFYDLVNYILDSRFFGYSLINFTGIKNGKWEGMDLIKRHNIAPDRDLVSQYTYSLSGINFTEQPWWSWVLWVPTPTDIGVSKCGYGLLYPVALYEIFCRNLMGYNGDFVELFAQPIRIGSTLKTEGDPGRDVFEAAIRDMGSSNYMIKDPSDEVELMESKLGGTGYQGYDNFEKRCEAKITKMILGHADAMDSTPGKLGSNEEVDKALEKKEVADNMLVCSVVNDQLLPKMRELGFNIPEGDVLYYKNNKEEKEIEELRIKNNKMYADTALTMKNAGLKMSAKYFEEKTGIPTEEIIEETEEEKQTKKQEFTKNVKNKLGYLYEGQQP